MTHPTEDLRPLVAILIEEVQAASRLMVEACLLGRLEYLNVLDERERDLIEQGLRDQVLT